MDAHYERLWEQTTPQVWARVKVVHAQWQVGRPKLRLRDTVTALLSWALEHIGEAEVVSLEQGHEEKV